MAIVHPEGIKTIKETEAEAKVEKEKVRRAGILAECVRQWNSFVKGLLSARVAWEKYKGVRLDNAIQLEEFPLEVQKMFYLANPQGDFDLLVEEIITHPNVKEYLKELLVPIK